MIHLFPCEPLGDLVTKSMIEGVPVATLRNESGFDDEDPDADPTPYEQVDVVGNINSDPFDNISSAFAQSQKHVEEPAPADPAPADPAPAQPAPADPAPAQPA